MKTCKVSDLFIVKYGVNLELNSLIKDDNGINFISRTSKNNGVSARVKPIIGIEPLPAGTLTVAAGGSVMETFLQLSPYYSGRDLYYLTPRVEMSNEIKLFYCLCLRRNKYKYSYGRQANMTLEDLQILTIECASKTVEKFSIQEYGKLLIKKVTFPNNKNEYPISNITVPLHKLFNIKNGIASSQVIRSKYRKSENWVPYIRPSYRQETSIDAFVNKLVIPENKLFPSETLYVSTDGQESHTFSYVSTFEFVPNSNISVLIPKRNMSIQEKLYYANCITNNRYKFSYGRKPKGERLKSILLPAYPPVYVVKYNIDKVIESFGNVLDQI